MALRLKKKKKKGAPVGLLVGVGVGVVLLLLIVGGVAATVYIVKNNAAKPVPPGPVVQNNDGKAKDEPKPPPVNMGVPIVPGIKEGNPAVKAGGASIIGNVRGQGYRAERRSELKQIGIAFIDFCDTHKGANRNLNNFLAQLNTYGPIRDAIKDGYYTVNMQADVASSMSIIAWETQIDNPGYLCVMGDTSVAHVPLPTWKAALGK